ncbi:hypothetical protein [Enhygromyxa salina]|uniref:Uncharacterized protein n=1 Tax=Enhygromyxa salina TaxID=215803 RepID=A0A2S9XNA0_9BACT|nr:hypothetical protein [Enhygromyxa salina]PRP94335.1 hypothetical protein ENSA7_78720 [Enhygromyxa salina]
MRTTTIEQAGEWGIALTVAVALVLAPVTVSAATPPSGDEVELGDAPEPADAEQSVVAEPAGEPPEPEVDSAEPVEESVAEPETEPEIGSEIGPTIVLAPDPGPDLETMRKVGIGLLAGGGVVATTGLGLTITFTVLGDRLQESADQPAIERIEQRDAMARVGGVLLASGLAFVAVGGVVLSTAIRRGARSRTEARVRVAPALGGLVISGRF